jgi:hypothetical protein
MKRKKTVMGVYAAPARPTFAAALMVAIILSLPFAALAVIEFTIF